MRLPRSPLAWFRPYPCTSDPGHGSPTPQAPDNLTGGRPPPRPLHADRDPLIGLNSRGVAGLRGWGDPSPARWLRVRQLRFEGAPHTEGQKPNPPVTVTARVSVAWPPSESHASKVRVKDDVPV